MKVGIRTITMAAAIIVAMAIILIGCVDNGVVAPGNSSIVLSANPQTVVIDPNTQVLQGQSQIDALVLDENGFLLEGISLVFRTTAGTLASGGEPIETNESGIASDVLTVTDQSPSPVTVTVLSGNLSESVAVTVSVVGQNIPPVASFFADPPNQAPINQQIRFDGTASNDPDGSIECYRWEIVSASGTEVFEGRSEATVTKANGYPSEQTLSVTLKVSDDSCDPNTFSPNVASQTYQITCPNQAPVAEIVSFSGVREVTLLPGQTQAIIEFDGTRSFDPEGTPLIYTWDCASAISGPSDVAGPSDPINSRVQCSYPEGIYSNDVSLYVTDQPANGCGPFDSSIDFVTVIVNPIP